MITSISRIVYSPCFGLIEPVLTFGQFCWILLAIGIGLFFLPRMLKNRLKDLLPKRKHKHQWTQVSRYSNLFFNLGLVISAGVALLAFSIVRKDEPLDLSGLQIMQLDYIETDVIRSDFPKPELPKPLPSVKLEIKETVAEAPVFEDKSIDASSEVERPVVLDPVRPALPTAPPPKIEEENEVPFRVVEQMPRFPGCEDMAGSNTEKHACATQKLLEFIYQNIKYPAAARENGIFGTVVVSFVVEKDGSLTNLEILRNIGGGCGVEALRVVNLMNEKGLKWMPGKQRGRAVRVQFNLPVKYRLD